MTPDVGTQTPLPVRPTQKQRILAVLSDGRWHTSAELYRTGCVLHSRISDLRNKDGYSIERRNVGGTGAEAHEYRLVGGPLVEAGVAHSDAQHVAPVSTSGPGVPSPELNQGSLDSSGQMVLDAPQFRKRQAA